MMKKIITTFLLFILTLCFAVDAHARIDMLPFRVIMEPRDRSGEVMVMNLSNETRAFRANIINYRQKEDGTYEKLDDPLNPLFDPQDIVRMSPQSFTLGPQGKQRVRIALRKPADLPDGEYRFHFSAISFSTSSERREDTENIAAHMAMNVGVAIPIIVRHGDLTVESKLQDFELINAAESKTNKPELRFTATRSGTRGTTGNIIVEWASSGSNFEKIGEVSNFNIFTEIDERFGSIALDTMPTQGSLRVTYKDEETNETYDEIIFDL